MKVIIIVIAFGVTNGKPRKVTRPTKQGHLCVTH